MRALWLACVLAACGGDGSPAADAHPDSPLRDASVDAPPDGPTAVRRVNCPSNPDGTITTNNFAFVPPSLSIMRNQIVKLMPENIHSVIPHPTKPSDPGLRNGATGEVRCVQFTEAGAFNYRCGPHASMEGVVNVTP
jgi:hypothetical protein